MNANICNACKCMQVVYINNSNKLVNLRTTHMYLRSGKNPKFSAFKNLQFVRVIIQFNFFAYKNVCSPAVNDIFILY